MDREVLRRMLGRVRSGKLGVDEALEALNLEPLERLGFATLDLQRAARRGFAEVVYGPGKTPAQIAAIVGGLHRAGQTAMVTRVSQEVYEEVRAAEPRVTYDPVARILSLRAGRRPKPRPGITVVTAGTSDLPVAEEAAVTAELLGNEVVRIQDVGIAGIHRLAEHGKTLARSRAIVAVAGMEGALPSVVAGLTGCPVIGVPTSTGYGIGRPGEAALMAMLSSCAAGLTVVNVDNGFGAGYAASLINRLPSARSASAKPPHK